MASSGLAWYVGGALMLCAGCAQLLSLDDYGDANSSSGSGASSASSASTGVGGAGGAGGQGAPPSIALDLPGDNAIGPPTRRLLTWTASDPDGEALVYDVYLGPDRTTLDAPYRSGVSSTEFVVQASTDGRADFAPDGNVAAIHLAPGNGYQWKVCARDAVHETCSDSRAFITDQSLAGWWRFDENPAASSCGVDTVCDDSGLGHHGQLTGDAWTFAIGLPDMLGGALRFPGPTTPVTMLLGGGAALNPASVTVQARVKLDPTPMHDQSIVDRRGGGAHGYQLQVANGTTNPVFGVTQYNDVGDSIDWLGGFAASEIQVVHGRWSYQGSCTGGLSLFVNGVMGPMRKQSAICHDNAGSAGPTVGANLFVPSPAGALEGWIDELIIYDRALADAEVLEAWRTSTLGLVVAQ